MECSDFCGIHNIAKKTYFTEEYYRPIINDIWFNTINEEKLSLNLYLDTANIFIKTLEDNMSLKLNNDAINDIYISLVDSLYDFSAAKQYQFLRECSVIAKESFQSFYEECESIFIKYYETYMYIEDDMVEQQAKSVINWVEITS